MASDSKWYLVCYDIRSSRRLRKVAKHVEGYGTRLQYSVFRCYLSQQQLQQLRFELTQKSAAEDDILLIPLCSRCVAGLSVTHTAQKSHDWPATPKAYRIV